MLTHWRLSNFKAVYDPIDLELRPLTMLVGANSSGKSTLIQSMLLLSQSIGNQVAARPIVLNGRVMRLGSFDDLASSDSKNSEISIGFTYEAPPEDLSARALSLRAGRTRRIFYGFPDETKRLICDVSFSASTDRLPPQLKEKNTRDLLQLQPYITKVRLETKRGSDSHDTVLEVVRSKESPENRLRAMGIAPESLTPELIESLNYEIVAPEIFESQQESYYDGPHAGTLTGARLFHFIPAAFSVFYDKTNDGAARAVRALISSGRAVARPLAKEVRDFISPELFARVIQIAVDFLALPENERLRTRAEPMIKFAIQDPSLENIQRFNRQIHSPGLFSLYEQHYTELLRIARGKRLHDPSLTFVPTASGAHVIENLFTNQLRYLGPLRDEPKPFYPLEGSVDPEDVGFKGEFTAAVIDLHKRTRVLYIPTSNFVNKEPTADTKEASLEQAIVDWLKYLGVVNEVRTADMGVFGHQLRVAAGEGEALHNLVHVGVGVSQVLPILVMSLLSEPGTTLIFEQPELHLHPRVQTLLADFLLSMILSGRQCIVETHSEYIINRLRLRAARDTSNALQRLFSLYFIEKEAGHSKFRQVHINEYGAIDDWPRGFFDQSPQEAERILRAAMEKRKSRR